MVYNKKLYCGETIGIIARVETQARELAIPDQGICGESPEKLLGTVGYLYYFGLRERAATCVNIDKQ